MSFSRIRLTTAGESHGPQLTIILEGIPAQLVLSQEKLAHQMKRRQLGFGRGGRMKIETDEAQITGGVRFGKTLGSPISMVIVNRDFENWRSSMAIWGEDDQKKKVNRPRPGHTDLAGGLKYGEHDLRNILERASARETAGRTAAGSICRQLLDLTGIEIASHVLAIGSVESRHQAPGWESIAAVQESDVLRCCDADSEKSMVAAIEKARNEKETLGGIVEVVARNVVPGLGSHVSWDRKLDGRIAQAMLSIPAIKGVEIGDAFRLARTPGSQAHDEIRYDQNRGFLRNSNRAAGLEGGITNGEEIRIRLAMKPLSTLMKPLQSVDVVTKQPQEAIVERSDVCSVPAAGVVGEAMLALVLADALLEKFAGDTVSELLAAFRQYQANLKSY